MAITVIPFEPYHVLLLKSQGVQGSQVRQLSHVPASYASVTRLPGPAVTAMDGDQVVMCGGMVVAGGPNYGLLWACLSANAGRHMLFLHRAVRRFIDMHPVRRMEATVEKDFFAGCRWLQILDFEYEGDMRGYGDDGETHERWARVI